MRTVRLHEPSFGEEEIEAASSQMRTTQVTMGKRVRGFEEQCASFFGAGNALMCNSGSSANLLAIAALSNPTLINRMMPGDEVIVPALSWATTVWPIIQHNLIPVFVDCDLATYNFDYDALERAVTPKTRAIMLVHVYGNPCDMNKIVTIAKKYNLFVIEDTCESMGATFADKAIGTIGDIGTMSLYYSHHITTLEGGLCFSDNFQLIELMRVLRAHGWSREADQHSKFAEMYPEIDPRFLFVNVGYNLRPTEVQAAIGEVQLTKLNDFISNRRRMHQLYRDRLAFYNKSLQPQEEQEGGRASWFGFCLTLSDQCQFSLKDITSFLQSQGIETRPIIAGNMAKHPALKMYPHRVSGTLDNCDTIMKRGFAVGCHHAITEDDVNYVCDTIDKFMRTRQI